MPTIIRPSPDRVGHNTDQYVRSNEDLLRNSDQFVTVLSRKSKEKDLNITHSSYETLSQQDHIVPLRNGLVQGMLRAFQQDLHVILCPDDVWLAILTQIRICNTRYYTLYGDQTKGNLHRIITHDSRRPHAFEIPARGRSFHSVDVTQELIELVHNNGNHPEDLLWLVPDFSTTTDTDRKVAAVAVLSMSYVEPGGRSYGGCGFPSITLLGQKSDWKDILQRVLELPKHQHKLETWATLLVPIIQNMIKSFEAPDSNHIKQFWLKACHVEGVHGSGDIETLSGWSTAFCFFSSDAAPSEDHHNPQTRDAIHGDYPVYASKALPLRFPDRARLVLNGVKYPIIETFFIPKAFCDIHVVFNDKTEGIQHWIRFYAGCPGVKATESEPGSGTYDTVQPFPGWWAVDDGTENIDKDIEALEYGTEEIDREIQALEDMANLMIW